MIADLEELPGVIWGGGGPSPAVTLVEFYDYNCPWCRGAAGDIAALMKSNRDLRVGLVQNAILSPQSMQAAKVHLALLQVKGAGAAHALHDRLFATPGRIDEPVRWMLRRNSGPTGRRSSAWRTATRSGRRCASRWVSPHPSG
jgi:hypothetical protein